MEQQRRNGIGQPAALGPFVAMVLVAALSAALPASAQTVQKCVDAAGHVTLTSSECGAGHRLVASYDAVPEPVPVAPVAAAAEWPGAVASRSRGAATSARRGTRGGASRVRAKPNACDAARARREKTLQRVGLKRNFDLLRKLDDEVWAACR